ncbi:capsular polysaccharide biosynthesis protein [[Enterobacter] lignolyticus]|uniref:Capsule biosynthesis protein n=1 Tax=[Enterobacter] lignolyticus TaxID=1334193 RepID=A0A806X200_9ENTR|nr:capsular polysaccharide biosynthesis protein [[Enterobacter] lignolyticus]ALR75350.1 capsule biosynthesis protein [[Enterobacter] lignolyticus]
MIGIFSSGIWRIPHLEALLGQPCRRLSSLSAKARGLQAIAVWGERPTSQRPIALAKKAGLPVIRLEDGFIRSLGLGINGDPPLSIVTDDLGIYYDASRASRLEKLIQDSAGNAAFAARTLQAIDMVVQNDLSKYNHAPPFSGSPTGKETVLVVDQTQGDVSVTLGGATERQFAAMLSRAIAEHPDADIWVKTHPDVLCGKKRGYLSVLPDSSQVRLLAQDVSPQSLLRHVGHVYTVTSQYGFEALIAGKKVTCFGLPWYAGWGLTDDRHPLAARLAERRGNASLSDLVSAAWFRYARYVDPQTGTPCSLFRVLEHLKLQRAHHIIRRGALWAPGMTLWKGSIIKPFLKTTDNQLIFSKHPGNASVCIAWGVNGEKRWQPSAEKLGIPVWRMEDGFLRSAGLGSDLQPPLSLVLDKTGIYYDATRPSDLEHLLNHSQLTPAQRLRAGALQQALVTSKVSKYNLGARWRLPPEAAGRRVLLVPGQVENDASIATGTFSVNTNLSLLQTARSANPDAFIIYKPHPDVLAGNRPGHIPEETAGCLADIIVRDADIIECIQQVDEVHTMTSLCGFEALIHGKAVHCYGMPFYAGWGLTHDIHHCQRRIRKLTLADLIYHTLISYPTYVLPDIQRPVSVETALRWLEMQPRAEMRATHGITGWIARNGRKLNRLGKTLSR